MSKYQFVEKPLLNQLAAMEWLIIEHPQNVIPTNPAISLRDNFREIVIKMQRNLIYLTKKPNNAGLFFIQQ